jgi:hypothetical protein
MNHAHAVISAIQRFLEWCPHRQFDFPLGGHVPVLAEAELALLRESERASVTKEELRSIRERLTLRQAYSLVIFAVRSALFAARTGRPNVLRAGLLGVLIDDGLVDWRDMLAALALTEECARRLHIEFDEGVQAAAALMATDGRQRVITGYLSRTPEMREIDVLGFAVEGTGSELTFRSRD